MWEGLGSLEAIYLSQISIQTLPAGAFRPLTNLKALFLWGNKLTEIRSDIWDGLKSMNRLHLESNQIATVLPGSFSELPSITHVSLSYNDLPTIREDVFNQELFSEGHIPKLILDMSSNPLECDTRICWLKAAEDDGLVQIANSDATLCSNYEGLYWTEVQCSLLDQY